MWSSGGIWVWFIGACLNSTKYGFGLSSTNCFKVCYRWCVLIFVGCLIWLVSCWKLHLNLFGGVGAVLVMGGCDGVVVVCGWFHVVFGFDLVCGSKIDFDSGSEFVGTCLRMSKLAAACGLRNSGGSSCRIVAEVRGWMFVDDGWHPLL